MNARLYDPVIGRFLSPDPYVQAPGFSQSFNRYSYCLNNPLIYTDPDGENPIVVAMIIGAAIGGYSGYKIADAKGYSFNDGKMYSYILGGAIIGGISGYVGSNISVAGGAAWWAGAAAGAVGGAGFSGLATNWNPQAMWNGFWNGAAAGFVGGYVGSLVGGGWGALAGGMSSNLTSQLLYNDGKFSDVNWGSVVGSGAFSLGMYHATSFASWKWGDGSKVGDVDIKYRTYLKMNATLQRARAWKSERGFWINKDGSFENFKGAYRQKHSMDTRNLQPPTGNAKYMVHTHWQPDDFPLDLISMSDDTRIVYKTGNPFQPSSRDTNEINRFNVEGLILTNRNIIQYLDTKNYIRYWDYPMTRYFHLFWWF